MGRKRRAEISYLGETIVRVNTQCIASMTSSPNFSLLGDEPQCLSLLNELNNDGNLCSVDENAKLERERKHGEPCWGDENVGKKRKFVDDTRILRVNRFFNSI
ncbi:hypothetical protein HAX54_007963 [Datura stramonium]|uniref:Uncharacterized protein n=1 Tax=Datura stramonium TaxID=4076 RepID=A0ABS8RVB6_DATST|nr:hypothetical protein [Datura stramonium]